MSDFIIQTKDLIKKYEKKNAIDGLSVNIRENGIIGLIGRNGSGKTTLMKLWAGLLNKTGGSIEVLGEDPMDNLRVLSNVVYTYHDMEYEESLKLKNIFQNYKVMFNTFDYEFALRLLKYFNINVDMKYKHLSEGMTSLFNFICGLSCRARLTMFDEPVLGMDVTVRKAAYEVLLRDYNEHPRTIIISSHLLSELEGILSDILLIDNGKLVLYSDIDDLRCSAYRVEGDRERLEKFCKGKNLIYLKNSNLGSDAVIYESYSESVLKNAEQDSLCVSTVRPEDLCVYLTRENKDDELECLWQKVN